MWKAKSGNHQTSDPGAETAKRLLTQLEDQAIQISKQINQNEKLTNTVHDLSTQLRVKTTLQAEMTY